MFKRFLLILAVAAASLSPAAAATGTLRAGAARIEIVPPPEVFPALVHDPIYIRALVLESGKDRLILLSVDSPGLGRTDELLDTLSAEFKLPRDHIFMAATHDHSAPFMSLPGAYPYFDFVRARMVEAVRQASGRLKPAKIGFRTGKAYVNVNRDEKAGDHYILGFNPDGPSDKTVAVMTVSDSAGKPIAIYANYAVHGVVMFFSKTKDGQIEITGDLPGATSRLIEDRLGGDVVALWTSGAAGDQNPVYTSARYTKERGLEDFGAGGWTLMEAQARRLGEEIVRVVGETGDFSASADIAVRTATLTCPGQKPAKANAPAEPGATPWGPTRVAMADADPVKIALTLAKVGDIALAGVGGELYTEIGMAVKARSPFERTMVVTHLPGNAGYIPSDRAFAMPSEKAMTASMKPGCADAAIPGMFETMGDELIAAARKGK